jgi:hypothetical protein
VVSLFDDLASRAGLPREAIVEALHLATVIEVTTQRIEFWQTDRSTKSIIRW